jgi:outer membrane protein OmpA-like peptidoglycan-associated protein
MNKLFFFLMATMTISSRAQNMVVFREDFNNNKNNWEVFDQGNARAAVSFRDSTFSFAHRSTTGLHAFQRNIPFDPTKDFYIESALLHEDGDNKAEYGLLWGTSGMQGFYNFVLSPYGIFRIFGMHKGKYIDMESHAPLDILKPKGQANIFRIEKKNDSLHFFMNGYYISAYPFNGIFGQKTGFIIHGLAAVKADYFEMGYYPFVLSNVDHAVSGRKKENLGKAINSEFTEITPVISPDGKTLYINRRGHPDNIGDEKNEDIWYSETDANGKWTPLKNIGLPLNNYENNSVISVSPDGNTLLISNTYNPDGSPRREGVSISKRSVSGWSLPVAQKIENFYNNNKFKNFFLSADQTKLLMSLERNDTKGDLDLYISFVNEDGTWTEPLNLGANVNTYAADITPFLAADNITLYYASEGLAGYGSADIYMTRRLDHTWTKWSTPRNLGPEVNSADWDAYYTIPASGEYAYLVSYQESLGDADIFRIPAAPDLKPDPVALIYGKVLDQETKMPVAAGIEYYDLANNRHMGIASSDPANGNYRIVLPGGFRYSFLAEHEDYYSISDNIALDSITEYTEIKRDLYLAPIQLNLAIRLNNVFFEFDRSQLLTESFPEIDRLAEVLKKHSRISITIGGHTDDQGDENYNQQLSEFRAKAVKQYLIKKGIAAHRIEAIGYGESKPIATNETPEGRALNRRVEFVVNQK